MQPAQPLSCTFLASAAALAQCPADAAPEAAFAGRSNAGKSSTLNRLAGSRSLARIGKTPGRTQLINFFNVADGGRLVDLPGYGYARAAKSRRAAWGQAVDAYLQRRSNLVALVLVMDARRPLEPFDRQMIDWCAERQLPLLALINKADKLGRGAGAQALRTVRSALAQRDAPAERDASVEQRSRALLFSAKTGFGAGEAIDAVRTLLEVGGFEPGGGDAPPQALRNADATTHDHPHGVR